jgi:hypothetical protein
MEPRREKAEEKQQNWDGDVWDQEEKRQKKKLKKEKRKNMFCQNILTRRCRTFYKVLRFQLPGNVLDKSVFFKLHLENKLANMAFFFM